MTPVLDFEVSPSVVLSREEHVVECDHEGWPESGDAFATANSSSAATIGARLRMMAAAH